MVFVKKKTISNDLGKVSPLKIHLAKGETRGDSRVINTNKYYN